MNSLDLDRQSVAGKRSLYVKWSGLRVAAQRPRRAFFIDAPGVDCRSPYGIAGIDVQHRNDRLGEETGVGVRDKRVRYRRRGESANPVHLKFCLDRTPLQGSS